MKKILQVLAIKPVGGVGSFLKNMYQENMPYPFDILESGKEIGGEFDEFFQKKRVQNFPISRNQI